MNKETIKSFTDLNSWKESHKLVVMTYKLTNDFPKEEIFGLVSQMRRCAVSITSNIAEGFSRQSYKEKAQFYSMSQGSVTELQNQLITSKDVGFVSDYAFKPIFDQSIVAHKLISGLIKKSKIIHNS